VSDSILRAAAVQMTSTADLRENLDSAKRLIDQAAERGASLVTLPEYFVQISSNPAAKFSIAEEFGRGPIQDMLAEAAHRHGIWVAGGSMPLKTDDPIRVSNTLLMFGPDGRCVSRYDKCNLFSIRTPEVTHDESLTMVAGAKLAVVDHPWGRIGLAICYDIRFPTFFERLGAVDLILLPAAFTMPTGAAHWELLLRARAIDNQAFVLASAQGGLHASGRQTWGHSMVVDPWGRVVAEVDQGESVIVVDLDHKEIERVRASLPVVRDRQMNHSLQGIAGDV
jgi:predicted amidohydrolase